MPPRDPMMRGGGVQPEQTQVWEGRLDANGNEHLPVIPIEPPALHRQKIVDFALEENLLKFIRPSRWVSINLGKIPLFRLNWVVTLTASLVLWAFIIGALVAPSDENGRNTALKEFNDIWQYWITANFTWLYIGTQDAWVVFIIYLAASKYGHLKLGKDREKPFLSDFSWFAMLFTCGVAVGFFSFGVSEPITYYRQYANLRKPGYQSDDQRAQQAIFITLYHWGFHAWGCYILAALLLGFVAFRWDMPLTLRTAFFPMVGDVVHGPLGDMIDSLSMVCTTFGVCTSLGIGVNVIITGLHRLNCGSGQEAKCANNTVPAVGPGKHYSDWAIATILIITLVATVSVVAGLKHGLKNIALTAFMLGNLLLFNLLFMDNTWYLLNSLVQSFGHYIQWVIQVGFETDAFQQLNIEFVPDGYGGNQLIDQQSPPRALKTMVETATGEPMDSPFVHFGSHDPYFIHWWTIFYWGWWISWVPFVGMFVARISRGRTIRQVVIGGLCAPILYTFLFMIVLGCLGIKQQRVAELALHEDIALDGTAYPGGPECARMGYDSAGQPITPQSIALAEVGYYALSCRSSDNRLYDTMEPYGKGIGTWLQVLCVVGVTLYFVTSSDSGSYVDDTLSAGGMLEPPIVQRIYWCLTEGMCAVALFAGGGEEALKALRAVSICMGLPLTFVLCFMCASLLRACKYDMMEPDIHNSTRFLTGLFDWTEGFQPRFVNSKHLPSVKARAVSLAVSFFAPFISMHAMHKRLFPGSWAYANTALSGVAFIIWVGCMLGELGTNNASFIGWTSFFFFGLHMTSVRFQARTAYNVYGFGPEDLAACLFMYPFVASQLDLQARTLPIIFDPTDDPNVHLDRELEGPDAHNGRGVDQTVINKHPVHGNVSAPGHYGQVPSSLLPDGPGPTAGDLRQQYYAPYPPQAGTHMSQQSPPGPPVGFLPQPLQPHVYPFGGSPVPVPPFHPGARPSLQGDYAAYGSG